MCSGVSRPPWRIATSSVLDQSQPEQSLPERPVARDYLCDVMCCRALSLELMRGKKGEHLLPFVRQVQSSPSLFFSTSIISAIGIFIIFYSDDSWSSSTDPVSVYPPLYVKFNREYPRENWQTSRWRPWRKLSSFWSTPGSVPLAAVSGHVSEGVMYQVNSKCFDFEP